MENQKPLRNGNNVDGGLLTSVDDLRREGDGSALIFLGTGCSSAVPNAMCLLQPSDPPCHVCSQSLSIPPERNPNYRCNTSLLIDYCSTNGIHNYIIIDVGKTFKEQVLRWFTFHKIPRIDSIVLTHEHADAVLGLDDVRVVQPHSPTNDIDPTEVYLTQYAMDSIATKFPYLVQKKLRDGQEVRRVAQLDWKIIEESCDKPFVASGLKFVPLPVIISKTGGGQLDLLILDCLFKKGSHNVHLCLPQTLKAVKRICPKRALLIGMTHDFDQNEDKELIMELSESEGIDIQVQLAHDGLKVPIDL
ncbi:Tetratricopeptide repeat (TPR)-like superfamily protein isoform 1 [Hibiscus syriacus]|uniref:Tetratricopeptide repeat (TPR)-like superfamily protein isoform 1 n=1 Tax=Hibiscus syriacus TaxID=106335 RepID=A0A6A2WNT5_HIBSY|nr:Tetratricopeptide repeat (TPR)-like superfamily protein isoform 1 [Hibiscus syriacus]